ncbi:phosphatidylserine/phosphatidylglycerophosphate/cardiolipin synthase family protein [Sphingomonas sp.]|jgi:cardiolipin synthase|uniref:phospholipase D-like domain-containing protein n=1 Tax=Sphingomonas sp. TaxID=28214 RepID=UPI002E37E1CD|nr:phosphatidylserine/phosphatidylglycerophosphate/cardiolipin synthase family protein [Sphingomonas sp.]HEX4695234.1 phosphatidylserine/phosphatidylglycerophosphate/cardiolipin synthase family protein [Sphingomonas sp.]
MAAQPSFTVDGDTLRLITEGPERLQALLDLIAGAEQSLRVLYYIYVDDEAGAKVRQALIDAAKRGVDVRLIVDGLGSEHAQAHNFFDPLNEAGVAVCRFVPRWGRRYLLRNHQKLALADESRVIIGGFNIQDSYFGTAEDQGWRDLGFYVEGPSAAHLTGYFDALDAWAKREHPPLRSLRALLSKWSEPAGKTRWLFGGPTRNPSPWARSVRADLDRAMRVDLISAYFAPSPGMLRRLDRVGQRGAVRLVLASKNDHGAAIWASRFTYAGLLRKRVRIYEYQPTKLHTKLFVIDDIVYVGSANYDIRSLFLNLELMLRIEDKAFADYARGYVDGEIANSEAITPTLYKARTSLWTRIKQAAAFFVMTVLDYNVTRRLNFGREKLTRDDVS